MTSTTYILQTRAEADAFSEGIALANDSALSVEEIETFPDGSAAVTVLDEDGDMPDDY